MDTRNDMTRIVRLLGVFAALALGGAAPPPASAGGPFARLVGVGANGASVDIRLQPSGPRSDTSLFAPSLRVAVPTAGYVRLFPLNGGLPGVPGRYYPAEKALCWSWTQPDRDCRRASIAAAQLLAPVTALPRWQFAPTVLAQLDYQGRRVRPELANLLVGLELAFDRRPEAARSGPGVGAFAFVGHWQGPQARLRPRRFTLGPRGVYSSGLLYPLGRGVWSFATRTAHPRRTPPA
jgi:hypothetical protein